jgi:hypothetical protein
MMVAFNALMISTVLVIMASNAFLPRLSAFAKAIFSPLQSDLRHAAREARLNKCNYCLGFTACFIAVTLVAFMYTALGFAPIFFLELSEYQLSQVDLRVTASPDTHATFLNFSAIERTFRGTDQEYSTMRIPHDQAMMYHVCNPAVEYNVTRRYAGCAQAPACLPALCSAYATAALFAVDFAREDRMGLGTRWNVQPPPLGSVLVQSDIMA